MALYIEKYRSIERQRQLGTIDLLSTYFERPLGRSDRDGHCIDRGIWEAEEECTSISDPDKALLLPLYRLHSNTYSSSSLANQREQESGQELFPFFHHPVMDLHQMLAPRNYPPPLLG